MTGLYIVAGMMLGILLIIGSILIAARFPSQDGYWTNVPDVEGLERHYVRSPNQAKPSRLDSLIDTIHKMKAE
jgi:hypothetical protein